MRADANVLALAVAPPDLYPPGRPKTLEET